MIRAFVSWQKWRGSDLRGASLIESATEELKLAYLARRCFDEPIFLRLAPIPSGTGIEAR